MNESDVLKEATIVCRSKMFIVMCTVNRVTLYNDNNTLKGHSLCLYCL